MTSRRCKAWIVRCMAIGFMTVGGCSPGVPMTGAGNIRIGDNMEAVRQPGKDDIAFQSDYNRCQQAVGPSSQFARSYAAMSQYAVSTCMRQAGNSIRMSDITLGAIVPDQSPDPTSLATRHEPMRPTSQQDLATNTPPMKSIKTVPTPPASISTGPAVNPITAADVRFVATLDAIIRKDAAGWIMNNYDAGSVTNIQAVENKGKAISLQGSYTFNGGQPGWVRVDFQNSTPCLEYWDSNGNCRPLDQSRMAILVAAAKESRASSYQAPPNNSTRYNDNDLFGQWFGGGPFLLGH
jgi:hypothetical protein